MKATTTGFINAWSVGMKRNLADMVTVMSANKKNDDSCRWWRRCHSSDCFLLLDYDLARCVTLSLKESNTFAAQVSGIIFFGFGMVILVPYYDPRSRITTCHDYLAIDLNSE